MERRPKYQEEHPKRAKTVRKEGGRKATAKRSSLEFSRLFTARFTSSRVADTMSHATQYVQNNFKILV